MSGTINVPSTYDPSIPGPNALAATTAAATAKDPLGLNIDIATVLLESVTPNPGFLESSIASEDLAFADPDIPTPKELAEALVEKVTCSSN